MNELGASRALYRGGLFLLVIAIVALILYELFWVLVQLFVASIVAAAMTPLVNAVMASMRARRRGRQPRRGLVVVVVFVLAGVITAVAAFVIVRAIVRETGAMVENLPQYAEAFRSWLASIVVAYPGVHEIELDTWIAVNMQAALNQLPVALDSVVNFLSFATGLFGGFLAVLLTSFMALYLTIDAQRMRDYIVVFWPADRQQQVGRMTDEMSTRLGHWAIAQGALCLIIGGGAWLGLQLIGVPYSAMLGLVWALAEFAPGIGPFLSAIPSILLGFAVSPAIGIAAAVFSLAWSQVENNIITPKVMGTAVELHPLVVLVALVAGIELLGIAGGLLAIPVAATLAVVIDSIRLERLQSQVARSVDGLAPTEPAAPHTADPVRPAS